MSARSARASNRIVPGTFALMTLLIGAQAGQADEFIEGPVQVIDGDTLRFADVRVRIYGIDAPDIRQTCVWKSKTVRCGVLSGDALKDLVFGASVKCVKRSVLADKTVIATCTADDRDIGRNLVHTGWSLADVRQSKRYIPVEEKARKAKRGLWRGPFVKPWDWKHN
jgi:endonuclease YncB( thermonuclease family)